MNSAIFVTLVLLCVCVWFERAVWAANGFFVCMSEMMNGVDSVFFVMYVVVCVQVNWRWHSYYIITKCEWNGDIELVKSQLLCIQCLWACEYIESVSTKKKLWTHQLCRALRSFPIIIVTNFWRMDFIVATMRWKFSVRVVDRANAGI